MPKVSKSIAMNMLVESIDEQLGLICGDANQVRQDCAEFSQCLNNPPSVLQKKYLRQLAKSLIHCDDTVALPVYELLESAVKAQDRVWPLLKILLKAENEDILERVIKLTLRLVDQSRLPLKRDVIRNFACLMDSENSPFENPELLDLLVASLNENYSSGDENPLLLLLCSDPEIQMRKFAASILNRPGVCVPSQDAEKILGKKAYGVLASYLDYTRAGYGDLFAFCRGRKVSPKVVKIFADTSRKYGEALVREAIATFGWSRVSMGLKVQKLVDVSLSGNLPLFVDQQESFLFQNSEAVIGEEVFLITAHGGAEEKHKKETRENDPVDRFRRLNITHAELLGEILDVAPLDKEKVGRIVHYIASVVETYGALFSDVSDECSILDDVWLNLHAKVGQYLGSEPDNGPLSADLTRLVLAFEEPASLGEVRTIHGLKRYLHQKGLKLGFGMVGTSESPNRTVDIMLAGKDGQLSRTQTIRYTEFEGGVERLDDPWLPYPVQVVAEGLSRQLLYGNKKFPGIDVYIFGNEVHYYITFRNHPAFLRVDFSPPQRGGMLDLEYYGVSNYELDVHPNISLDFIKILFRELAFDVKIEGTRLFIRYDKERSNSLGDLCEHVETVFRLVPYLMDFDWIIGSLQLPDLAKNIVVQKWSERFYQSGVLPLKEILNENRSGILIKSEEGPTGKKELVWDGSLPYRDRFSALVSSEFWSHLRHTFSMLQLPSSELDELDDKTSVHLSFMEKVVLAPVQEALLLGRIKLCDEVLCPAHPDVFQVVHEAEYFASLLAGDDDTLASACVLARPLWELEHFLKFTPTGFVGSLVVERARVAVRGGHLTVFAVRDAHGVIRMGAFTKDSRLFRNRASKKKEWKSNALLNAGLLWELMRSANYLASAPVAGEHDFARDLRDLRDQASSHRSTENRLPLAGECILRGLKAAPGRAVGRTLFRTEGRKPRDLKGAILVAEEVRPTDNQFLSRSAGIISTGGAVLSHAALLAIQFGKPGIVANARWNELGPSPSLNFAVTVYREMERVVDGFSVCVRTVVSRRYHELVENDLVILDANEGQVKILGQQRDTLALWEGIHLLGDACNNMSRVDGDEAILEVRAQQLRARHQIQKILDRLTSPVLTAFALEELVFGETLSTVKNADKQRLLSRVLANAEVAVGAQEKLVEISNQLADRCSEAERVAKEQIPTSEFLYEILGLRLRAANWNEAYDGAVRLLERCGMAGSLPVCLCNSDLSSIARTRLVSLREELLARLQDGGPSIRHLIRRIGRIGIALGTPSSHPEQILGAQEYLAAADSDTLKSGNRKFVLESNRCGLESNPQIGWKAANLAEIDRLAGAETVPHWFVVTNFAFNQMLEQPVGSAEYLNLGLKNLGEAIRHILKLDALDNKQKAGAIRNLWENTIIPPGIRREVATALAGITSIDYDDPFVAVRSSSCDEDTEKAMRAGEFDTFLYVRGEQSIFEHLLLVWGGLWTERSLYRREASGCILQTPAGGVIVQRMVCARVSGVLQTVNVARGDLREILVNVGLGLGEGIVSGLVAADLITVVKDFLPGEDPVHLNYLTNDKPRQMVFDDHRDKGTRLEDTLYHQRLRPALEYTELCEIIAKASALEHAYGYPLDMEFAIEETRLWILQARPIATFSAELQESLEKYPLKMQVRKTENQECCYD